MRVVFAQAIRSVYERLDAAMVGLQAAGICELNAARRWQAGKSDNIAELVLWCRRAIRAFEFAQRNAIRYTRVFLLGSQKLGAHTDTDLQKKVGEGNLGRYQFSLNSSHFREGGTSRIEKVGVAIVFNVNNEEFKTSTEGGLASASLFDHVDSWHRTGRRQFTFSAELTLPWQNASINGAEVEWSKPSYSLDGEVFEWTGSAEKSYPSDTRPEVQNANPAGEWSISLQNDYLYAGKPSVMTDLRAPHNSTLWNFVDVALCLTMVYVPKANYDR